MFRPLAGPELSLAFHVILMIGGLVFFHELGHFLFARWFGIHVMEFSIGFGPKLFGWRGKANPDSAELETTEYKLCLLPIGGYVRLLGYDPNDVIPAGAQSVSYASQTIWRRFLVSFAGPLFNIILPFIIFFILGLGASELAPSVTGEVSPGQPAWNAGIRPGDRIVEIDGNPVKYWWEIPYFVASRPGESVPVAWEHLGQRKTGVMDIAAHEIDLVRGAISETRGRIGVRAGHAVPIVGVAAGSAAQGAGIGAWDQLLTVDGHEVVNVHEALARVIEAPDRAVPITLMTFAPITIGPMSAGLGSLKSVSLPPASLADGTAGAVDPSRGLFSAECLIHKVVEGSPAAKAGLKVGDHIRAFDDHPCVTWAFARGYLDGKIGEEITVHYVRDRQDAQVRLRHLEVAAPNTVNPNAKIFILGISTYTQSKAPALEDNDNVLGYAAVQSWERSTEAVNRTFAMLAALFTGRLSLQDGLGGPVKIAQMTAMAAEAGWGPFFAMMALLSVSLGLINLLPIPILDGGQILFLAVEGIRRKPVSMRFRMISLYIGLAFIVVLMLLVLRNDLRGCAVDGFIGGYWSLLIGG